MKLSFLLLLASAGTALAGTTYVIADGDVKGLADAIRAANASPGSDVIQLAGKGDYVISVPDTMGTGLPVIDSAIWIDGNGATLRRSAAPGTPLFTLIRVSPNGALNLKGVTVANGYAFNGGGGLSSEGETVIEASTFRDNRGNFGGAIGAVAGTMRISTSTIHANQCLGDGKGGAIYNRNASLLLVNATVAHNRTGSPYGGGAIYADGGHTTIVFSTIVENEAVYSGRGHAVAGQQFFVLRSILAARANLAGKVCDSKVFSAGDNLLSDSSCGGLTGQDRVGVDPELEPLADNGGPTLTLHPRPTSPVLNAVATLSACTPFDQRGVNRPQGNLCDIGAVEAAPRRKLVSWGVNGHGQLGTTTALTSRPLPGLVEIADVVAVSAGAAHSVALKADGSVWTFGYCSGGQCGNAAPVLNQVTPVQTALSIPVAAISAGQWHTLALTKDKKSVYGWGAHAFGNDMLPALKMTGDIQAIAAGNGHDLVLMADGSVWVWGRNDHGQLGDNTKVNAVSPKRVASLPAIKAIAAGPDHSLAVDTQGRVWTWGRKPLGSPDLLPTLVPNLSGVTAVAAGSLHNLALKGNGEVVAWGRNQEGQLGDGTGNYSTTPVKVKDLTGVTAINAFDYGGMALGADGSVRTWGRNMIGELGIGNTLTQWSPVQIPGIAASAIGAGYVHGLAVLR